MMTIDRIFNELASREFKFIVNGTSYALPHLNSMKPAVLAAFSNPANKDNNGDVIEIMIAQEIFDATGNAKFIKDRQYFTLKETNRLFRDWWKWSGVDMGKFLWVLAQLEENPDALEIDLLEMGQNFEGFFSMSLRTWVNLVSSFANKPGSALYTALEGLEYRWPLDVELLARINDVLVQANFKNPEDAQVPRPKKSNKKTAENITPTRQAEIKARLLPIF
jgi:hypothetical protein